jgi:predicted PurR-regulated permease PerM
MEATVRVGTVLLLVAWCFQIVQPFFIPIVWGMIIAVASASGFRWLEGRLGGRSGLAAAVTALLLLTVLIVPMVMLSGTLVGSAKELARHLSAGTLKIPPPPPEVGAWPIIGQPLAAFWHLASTNLEAALGQIGPQLKAIGSWLLSGAAGVGFGILQFVVAIVIAGFLLAHTASSHATALAIADRLAGPRGRELANLAEVTVRSVARGILGVSFIQAVAAGLGFLAVGLPGAGLWALLCLLLSVIQLGVGLIAIPAVIYVFYTSDALPAVAFLIWMSLVTVMDNLLKPILLGRGVDVPMAVVFIGAIGGFITSGIIGLFVGAVVLVLGYKLFLAWLHEGGGSEAGIPEPADRAESHTA